MNVEELRETIIQGFKTGSIKDGHIAEWKAEALKQKAEQERQKAEAAEQRRIAEAEKMKPANEFPRLWRYRNCTRMDAERLHTYCLTCKLDELQAYYDEHLIGKHREQYSGNSADAARSYLKEHIDNRINATSDVQKEKEQIAREREKLAEKSASVAEMYQETKTLHAETKKLVDDINPPAEKATKAYLR